MQISEERFIFLQGIAVFTGEDLAYFELKAKKGCKMAHASWGGLKALFELPGPRKICFQMQKLKTALLEHGENTFHNNQFLLTSPARKCYRS